MADSQKTACDGNSETRELVTDRGWAWVICVAQFTITAMSMGYMRSFGIVFVALQEHQTSQAAESASFMGVYKITFSIVCLVSCNFLLDKLTTRQLALVGSFIASAANAVNYFAESAVFYILSLGFLYGIGHALVFAPGMVILSQHFESKRTLAVALAVCGSSVGAMAWPPLIRFLFAHYAVRTSMLIIGGLFLSLVPISLLLVPSYEKRSIPVLVLPENSYKTSVTFSESRTTLEAPTPLLKESQFLRPETARRLYLATHSSERTSSVTSPRTPRHRRYVVSDEMSLSFHAQSISEVVTEHCEDTRDKVESKSSYLYKTLGGSLFKIPAFYSFIGYNFFGAVGVVSFSFFLPPFATENGVGDQHVVFLLGLYAGIDFFCRLGMGILADFTKLERYKILAVVFIILGTTYQLVHYFNSYHLIILYTVIFGSFSGSLKTLNVPIANDFFGDSFPKAYGYAQFSQGIFNVISYPLLGKLRDVTGDYSASCRYLGVALYLAAALLLLKPVFERCHGTNTYSLL